VVVAYACDVTRDASQSASRLELAEYQRLVHAGIVDKVEFLDGHVYMGEHLLAWSPSQVEAARQLGITLRHRSFEARR
jgi:hypothetical protein